MKSHKGYGPAVLARRSSIRVAFAVTLLTCAVVVGTALSEPVGSQVRVSQAGPNGSPDFNASNSAVAYSPQANRYLVVWEADDTTNGELEIFGRLVTAAGKPAGREFRISDMGPNGSPSFGAQNAGRRLQHAGQRVPGRVGR